MSDLVLQTNPPGSGADNRVAGSRDGGNLTLRTVSELSSLLKTGQITPFDLLEETIDNARRLCPFHALISLNKTNARKQAEQLTDKTHIYHAHSPLWGIPVSVKDIIDVANEPTTCGSAFFAHTRAIPQLDSTHAARWKRTGAVLSGKSHCTEFGYSATGANLHYGDCLNPHFPEQLTGGSSSGSAATVLGGAACIGIGTDTGGSIRVPAALCGLAGFRNSVNPTEWDGSMHLAQSLDAFGWMNRHLSDVSTIGHTLYPQLPHVTLPREPVVGALRGPWLGFCETPVVKAFEEFLRALKNDGFQIKNINADFCTEAAEIRQHVALYEARHLHDELLAEHSQSYDPIILQRILCGNDLTEDHYNEFLERKERFEDKIEELFDECDFLVLPAVPVTRVLPGQYLNDSFLIALTSLASVAGLPVLMVPWRHQRSGGIGFQVMARRKEDANLLACADKLAKLFS